MYETKKGSGYEPQILYRAATGDSWHRVFAKPARSIQSTVADLLEKLKVKEELSNAVWGEVLKATEKVQPAMSHKSRSSSSRSAVVFFQTHPFEGILRPAVLETDGKIRIALDRKSCFMPERACMAGRRFSVSHRGCASCSLPSPCSNHSCHL